MGGYSFAGMVYLERMGVYMVDDGHSRGYSLNRRRRYYENEVAKCSVFEMNRKQQLAKAKRKGYITCNLLEKYQFNSEELSFLNHAIWDDTGRCCDRLDKVSLGASETECLV